MIKSKIILIGIFTALLFLSHPASVNAAASENLNITLSPSSLELTSTPGSQVKTHFRIRNDNDTQSNLKITFSKFKTSQTEDFPIPSALDKNDQFPSWIKIDPQTFIAAPKEWQDVTVEITIPKEAAFGYYYALTIGNNDSSNSVLQGAKIESQVLLPLLLTVKNPQAVIEAKLLGFKVPKFVWQYLPVDFQVQIQNKGNILVKPRGNVFIHDGSGKDIAILEINQDLNTVLPQGKRTFTASWNDGFILQKPTIDQNGHPKLDSQNQPITHFEINWNKLTSFRIGKYSANLVMVYDNGKRDVPLESKLEFWVIPYTAIILCVTSLVVLIVILRLLIGLYISREIKKRSSP